MMKVKLVISSMLSIGIIAAIPYTLLAEEMAGEVMSDENPLIETLTSTSSIVSASASSVQLIPASPIHVSNCIPFGNNTFYGFTGFIYRDVPAFNLPAGGKIRFDLGNLNDVDIRRNIFLGTANVNPEPGVLSGSNVISQNITVDSSGWTQVAWEDQTPENPKGNNISGDYELTYTAEAPFSFTGGGLLIGFQGSPPASYADNGCEQVLVSADTNDASGNFYARFYYQPDLSTAVLDGAVGGNDGTHLGGVVFDDLSIQVTIDIKPGSDDNSINLCSNGAVPVAILGSETFNVNDINPDTLRLADAAVKVVGKKDPKTLCSVEDVNGDYYDDLVCHFNTTELGDMLDGTLTSATVKGETVDGTPIEGSDNIIIVKDECE